MMKLIFDPMKAVEILLYIAERVPNLYHALKIMYFADKAHLSEYGRLVSGDHYIAMRLGPVPSGTYDIVKFVRGDGIFTFDESIKEAFTVKGRNTIEPKRRPDLDTLSESEMECLDASISEYGNMSMTRLKKASHDAAYEAADENEDISLESIITTLPNGTEVLAYMRDE